MDAQLITSQQCLSPCSLALVEGQNIAGEASCQSPSIFDEKDWVEQRALISSMYVRDDMTLENIRRFMETTHGLRATKKMFKDRLSAWGVSKNLRDDEVVNLTRIKVSRDAVGKSITFLRYGTLIPPRRLYRRLREKRHLQQKVLKQGSSEADIDDLLQNYLPSRGLVALEPHPSAGLRGDEMLHIIESSIFPLRAFGRSDVRWCFEHMAYSPWLLYVGLFDRDPMAQTEAEREHAWEFIERACYIMRQDISRVPDESALLLLWVMSKDNVAGKQPLLGYQLMRHASQLFASSFGPKHPYSVLFTGAASMTYKITSYGCFWSRSREVLIDVVTKRLSSGMAEAPYRQMVPEVKRQRLSRIASKLRLIENLLPEPTDLTLLLNFVVLHQDIKHEEAEAECFRLGSAEISEKSWAETAVPEKLRSSSCAEVSRELIAMMVRALVALLAPVAGK